MSEGRTANLLGAVASALHDDLQRAAEAHAPELGQAAAAINLLGHEPDMPIERLRRALGLLHSGVVRLVDRLVVDGLVVRNASLRDGRAAALSLTEAGAYSMREIASNRQARLRCALALLSSAERTALDAIAEKLLRGLLRSKDHAYAICRLCDYQACVDCPVDAELRATKEPPRGDVP